MKYTVSVPMSRVGAAGITEAIRVAWLQEALNLKTISSIHACALTAQNTYSVEFECCDKVLCIGGGLDGCYVDMNGASFTSVDKEPYVLKHYSGQDVYALGSFDDADVMRALFAVYGSHG